MYSMVHVLVCVFVSANAIVWYEPQQVHIATGSSKEMTIVWSTRNNTNDSRVLYGKNRLKLDQLAFGSRTKFVDGGIEKRAQFIHTVILTNLSSDTIYYYMVGSIKHAYSDVLSFKTWPPGDRWSPRLVMYGDMGNENAQSLPRLQTEVARGMYDAILHVGDFAYDLNEDNARVGDEFLRQIEPLASSIPYMTCPGNHEMKYNFSNYKNRFRMPGDVDQRMYYSFTMGPVRFISTASEYMFYPQYGLVPVLRHYEWLENELKEANKPENRAKHPWVIVFGHRPMYCSTTDGDDCTYNESILRTGIPFFHILGWEKMFYEYGVDLALWAHEHVYERLWPIYNRKVLNGSYEHPYTNPGGPVHIIAGSPGNREKPDTFVKKPQYWSAFRSRDYGYSRLTVFNSSHLYMEQVSDNKDGAVIDKFMLIKDKHGPYKFDPTPIKPLADQKLLWEKLWRNNKSDLP